MKKYLLTALLGVFGLFGFTNATDYVFNVGGEYYTPENLVLSSDSIINIKSFSNQEGESYGNFRVCFDEDCLSYIDFTNDGSPYLCTFSAGGDSVQYEDNSCLTHTVSVPSGTYFVDCNSDICFGSLTLNVSSVSSGGSDSSEGLLSGGTAVFGGIISSLGSAVSEFIPYVAYIGLGLLGAIIGFVAIKRLINRVRAKIFGTFNSRRRK